MPNLGSKNDRMGVSPVIAVMLLLAITVILTAAVYVTVTSISVGPSRRPIYLGINIAKQGNFYSVNIIAASPNDARASDVSVAITGVNQTVLLPGTPLSNLPEFVDSDPKGILNSGDYIWLSSTSYPPGSIITFVNEQQLIFTDELPG